MKRLIFTFLTVISWILPIIVQSLECYQCDSNQDVNCSQSMDSNPNSYQFIKECHDQESTFCRSLFHTRLSSDGHCLQSRVIRECAMKDEWENWANTEDCLRNTSERICLHQCYTNGCNRNTNIDMFCNISWKYNYVFWCHYVLVRLSKQLRNS